MKRRRLFKTLGAAIVAAPVALVAASQPVQAAAEHGPGENLVAIPWAEFRSCTDSCKSPEEMRIEQALAAYYQTPEGLAGLHRGMLEYMGDARPWVGEPWVDVTADNARLIRPQPGQIIPLFGTLLPLVTS